jgi:hypothetical protein
MHERASLMHFASIDCQAIEKLSHAISTSIILLGQEISVRLSGSRDPKTSSEFHFYQSTFLNWNEFPNNAQKVW